jgi:hypothetical protein
MTATGIARPVQQYDRLQHSYSFECSEQFHLAELSPVCALIYGLAYRLTKGGEMPFFPSAGNIAQYINRSPHQVRRGLKELEQYGFLLLEESGRFRPNRYQVVSHKEWATLNQGRCCRKIEFPFSEDGDPLGQKLWAVSGGQVKFQSFQIQNLRTLEATDEEIIEEFQKFWDDRGQNLSPSKVSPFFYMLVKSKFGAKPLPDEAEQE